MITPPVSKDSRDCEIVSERMSMSVAKEFNSLEIIDIRYIIVVEVVSISLSTVIDHK